MVSGCFSFAWMGALAHEAGSEWNWRVVALARSVLVLFFVGMAALGSGTPLVFFRPRVLWMRSLAGTVSLFGTFYALSRLPVSTVLTLTNTFPIWVAILSWPVLGKPPGLRVCVAVIAGVSGVCLIERPSGSSSELAVGIALTAALGSSIAMLGLNQLGSLKPVAVVVHFSLVASIGCTFLLLADLPPLTGTPTVRAVLLLVGVGATASIGQLFLTKAFGAGDPAKVSVIGLSQVIFGLLLDLLWSQQKIGPWTFVGMALILAPTTWVMVERPALDSRGKDQQPDG